MSPSLRAHLIASIGAGLIAAVLGLCFGYSIPFLLAIQLAVTGGVLIWLRGPLWFPKLLTKYTWAPYAVGIFLIPLAFVMELGLPGFILAVAEGSVRKFSTHFDPIKGNLWTDLFYIVVVGALIVHRLIAGF